jgi:small subunit ribosomal protein S6
MQKYELLLILPGTLDDKEVEARSQEIVALVGEHGSDVQIQSMGKNRLAYPIKQIRYGYYFAITFKSDAKKVKELENKLGLMRDLLRAMVSHFNVDLSAAQRLAYTTQQQGAQPAEVREGATTERMQEQVAQLMEEKVAQAPESKVARPTEKLNMDQINKKLDDLMAGDVIPGV